MFILHLADGRPACALPWDAVATQSIGGPERLERGPSFAAEDLVTRVAGGLSTPRFDASAGVFGSGGIQPTTATPDNLSGSYTVPPEVREVSASVMVTDSFAGADGSAASGVHRAAGVVIRFSSWSTAAAGSRDTGWGNGAAAPGASLAGAEESAALARRSVSLMRSSVFINNATGTSGRSLRALSKHGPGGGATALATVQGASSLTVYQALRVAATDPAASVPAGKTIESYSVATPIGAAGAPAGATVCMPMKVTSSSYGFLNSSLTVFSDDFGTFAGIGQTFNGLTSLNIPEPPSIVVLFASVAGVAALRRRRKRP